MIKERDQYTKTLNVSVPADIDGNSLTDDGVLADVVASGMMETPGVVRNHVHGRFNDFVHTLQNVDHVARYEAAVKLAGIALRHAWENRIDRSSRNQNTPNRHFDTLLEAIVGVERKFRCAYVDGDHLATIISACADDPRALEAFIALVRATPKAPFEKPR